MILRHCKTLKIRFLTLLIVSLIGANSAFAQEIPTDPAVISAGEKLYKQNCAACHRVEEKLVGPALKNVYDRREIPWIIAFVKNSQKLIAAGDPIATQLYEEYNQVQMTSFDFSDEEILSVLAYVKDQTDNPPVAEVAAVAGEDGAVQQQGVSKTFLYLIVGGLILVFFLILIVLGLLSSVMTRSLKLKGDLDKEDLEVVEQRFNVMDLLRNKAFIGMVTFVFTAIVLKTGIDQLYTIGIQQGYQPEQPIAFSHKIHAGQFEIDCNYCHTGVRKSASANIPSANICMNCHGQIVKGTNTGTAEIEKIYAAIENDRPIEWVRIHNLPDLAYFNHAQHVAVGNIECQTCHGEIQEMEVVQQHALLTMGWCIDCHRQTEINYKGNEYYDKLVELHDSPDPMTVEDIGGLECAKCHY